MTNFILLRQTMLAHDLQQKDIAEAAGLSRSALSARMHRRADFTLQPGTQPLAHRPVVCGLGPAGLFAALRILDDPTIGRVYARCPEGGGIAYAVQNRLKKAAAFHIIDAEAEP